MFTDNFKYFQITQNANLSNLNCNMYKKHFLDIGIMLSGEMKIIYNDESQIVQKGYVWISDSRDLSKIIDNDNTSKFKILLSVRFSLLSIDDLKSIIHILKIYEELEDRSLF